MTQDNKMTTHNRTLRVLLTSLMMFTALSMFSCSALNHLQKQSGMRTKKIHLKDLGPEYLAYKNSDFDYFNTKIKSKKIKVKYRTFKFKAFDRFNKKATILYTKFKLAQKVNQDFDKQIKSLLKTGFKGESRKSLRQALRKRSSKKLKTVQKLGNSYDALSLTMKSLKDLIVDAKALIDESKGIVAKTKKEALAKPDKAILADKIVSESKRTIERLSQVIQESPKLVKSMSNNLKIADVVKSAKKL